MKIKKPLNFGNVLKSNIWIILLFTLIIFLHFYKVGGWFFFGIDEEYQSLLALAQIKDFHPIWIGLSAANTGFYVGPGLVYLHAILLWISHGDPIILAYAASTVGVITAVVFYFIVKSLFNKKVALITTALYSCSTFVVNYDRRFWNSTLVPLVAILIYWTLVKLQKDKRYLILLAFLLGCIFHIHASLFLYIPIILYFAVMSLRAKPAQRAERGNPVTNSSNSSHTPFFLTPLFIILNSLFIFLLIYSPLLIYDLVHNFDNLKTPLRMLTQVQGFNGGLSFPQHWQTFIQTISHFWINNLNHPFHQNIIAYLSILIIFIFLFKIKKPHENILATIIFIYLVMFFLFPGTILEYYYLGFFPFFSLIIALFLNTFNQKIYLPFLIIIILCNCLLFINQNPASGLASQKKLVIKTTKLLNQQPYYLDTVENYLYFGGWHFLFTVYGQKPTRSRADDHFGWIYPDEINSQPVKKKVVVTTVEYVIKGEKPNNIVQYGSYQALIYDQDN